MGVLLLIRACQLHPNSYFLHDDREMLVNRIGPYLMAVATSTHLLSGCSDDNCDVGAGRWEPKMGASLQQQLSGARDDSSVSVVITATDGDAAACVRRAVASKGGEVVETLGSEDQSLLATLSPASIKAIASRDDVQGVDAEFDDAPPP